MKVVLAGSTGFIGREVLEQCLHEPQITSILALSRRPLPSSLAQGHQYLKTIILEDFTKYPENVLQELDDADACIWSLGKASVPSLEEARTISFDYTMAAVNALQTRATREKGKKFRFVYLSGKIAERDQLKSLWYMQEPRRIRGQLETDLIAFADDHRDSFETYIVKPSMVLRNQASFGNALFSLLIPTVKVNVLAKTMIDVAIKGNTLQTFENSDLGL